MHTLKVASRFSASFLGYSLLVTGLSGCGTIISPYSPGSSTGSSTVASLTGNWLVTGSLPNSGPFFPLPPAPSISLALSLDESGGRVIANDSVLYTCSNGFGTSGSGGSGYLGTAPVAADGSFTLQTTGNPTVTFTLNGTVPQTAAESWSGTYSANDANAGCIPVAGSFTAAPIQPVTGTYDGSVSFGNNSGSTPLKVSLVLQQGSPGFVTTPNHIDSQNVLSGSITVQGASCFTSGTLALGSGQINGGFVQAQFAMNDGSSLHFDGAIEDVAASTLQLTSILAVGGQCNALYSTSVANLVRQ
jgi:hypothetical protein